MQWNQNLQLKQNNYTLMSIKEIAHEVYRGDSPSKYHDNGILMLQVNNIEPFEIIYENKKYISSEEYNKKPRFQLKENDLLVSGIGPPLGEVCFIRKSNLPLSAYNHITVIRPNEDIINAIYLCTFLNSSFGQMQMKKYYTGVRQIYLTNEWIEKILVPVPELSIQNKISRLVLQELEQMSKAEDNLKTIEMTIFDDVINKHLKIKQE